MCFTPKKKADTLRGEIFGHSLEPRLNLAFADHPRMLCSDLHFRLRFLLHRGRASLLMRQPLQICLPVHVFLTLERNWVGIFFFGGASITHKPIRCYVTLWGSCHMASAIPTHSFSRHLTHGPSENYFTKCFLSFLPDNDSSLLSIAGCQRFQPIWVCFKIWRPLKHPSNMVTCFIRIWNEAEFDVETAGNVWGWTFDTGDEWFCGFRRDELLGLVEMQAFSNGTVFSHLQKTSTKKVSKEKIRAHLTLFFV